MQEAATNNNANGTHSGGVQGSKKSKSKLKLMALDWESLLEQVQKFGNEEKVQKALARYQELIRNLQDAEQKFEQELKQAMKRVQSSAKEVEGQLMSYKEKALTQMRRYAEGAIQKKATRGVQKKSSSARKKKGAAMKKATSRRAGSSRSAARSASPRMAKQKSRA